MPPKRTAISLTSSIVSFSSPRGVGEKFVTESIQLNDRGHIMRGIDLPPQAQQDALAINSLPYNP
jgi:hypothetical protein